MKFKKVYCFGGDCKANEDDFIVSYIAENGKRIDVEFVISNQSIRSYRVDGKAYRTLKEAKAAC